jgi:hypothetical protein
VLPTIHRSQISSVCEDCWKELGAMLGGRDERLLQDIGLVDPSSQPRIKSKGNDRRKPCLVLREERTPCLKSPHEARANSDASSAPSTTFIGFQDVNCRHRRDETGRIANDLNLKNRHHCMIHQD